MLTPSHPANCPAQTCRGPAAAAISSLTQYQLDVYQGFYPVESIYKLRREPESEIARQRATDVKGLHKPTEALQRRNINATKQRH